MLLNISGDQTVESAQWGAGCHVPALATVTVGPLPGAGFYKRGTQDLFHHWSKPSVL